MIIQHGLVNAQGNPIGYPIGGANAKNTNVKKQETAEPQAAAKSSEHKLSKKAADFLSKLRSERSDFDFIIADAGDDHQALVKQSDKEFTVVYTSAELERMASDPKYAAEKNQQIETTLSMTKKICEQNGYVSMFGKLQSGNAPVSDEAKRKADGFRALHDKLYAEQTAAALEKINDGRQTALEIYRRMARGAVVSPTDEDCLMKYDPQMYQAAKLSQQMAKDHEDMSDKSLIEEFEKRHENDRRDYTTELKDYIDKMNESDTPVSTNVSADVSEAASAAVSSELGGRIDIVG